MRRERGEEPYSFGMTHLPQCVRGVARHPAARPCRAAGCRAFPTRGGPGRLRCKIAPLPSWSCSLNPLATQPGGGGRGKPFALNHKFSWLGKKKVTLMSSSINKHGDFTPKRRTLFHGSAIGSITKGHSAAVASPGLLCSLMIGSRLPSQLLPRGDQ